MFVDYYIIINKFIVKILLKIISVKIIVIQ